MNKIPAIVIDTGEYEMRLGFSDDLLPSVCFWNLIGKPKSEEIILGVDQKKLYIGDEIIGKEDFLEIQSVIVN